MPERDFHVQPSNSELTERANRLRAAVRAGGGNQIVSQRSGVPLSTLNNYLGGRDMKLSAVVALADACRVSLDWLAAGRGAMHPPDPSQNDRRRAPSSNSFNDGADTAPVPAAARLNVAALAKAIEIVAAVAGPSSFADSPATIAERIATTYALLTRPALDTPPPPL
jgi:hypothetical protein